MLACACYRLAAETLAGGATTPDRPAEAGVECGSSGQPQRDADVSLLPQVCACPPWAACWSTQPAFGGHSCRQT